MPRPEFVAVYPGKCGKLAMCRMEAQGQWFRMLMLMCESTRYGHLCTQDGRSLPTEIAARGCGLEVAHYELGLAELSNVGLIHTDANGVIFDPDMVEFAKQWSRLTRDSDALQGRRECDRERKQRSTTGTHVSGVLSSSLSCSKGFKDFQLPEWIPLELWEGFKDMRKKIRAPLTELAAKGIIKDLERIKATGGDPIAALNESIKRSWRGVFEQNREKTCTQPKVGQGPDPQSFGVKVNPAALERIRKREAERMAIGKK